MDKESVVAVKLTSEQSARLEALCRRLHRNKSDQVRALIDQAFEVAPVTTHPSSPSRSAGRS